MPNKQSDLIDIDESRIMAALSYVGILVLIPILMKKNDPFVLFHIKQGLVLLIGLIVSLLAAAWIPVVGNALFLVIMIFNIIALVQALLGKWWKIPFVGQIAEKFKL